MVHDVEKNKKLVLNFFERMSEKDARNRVDSIVELLSDDATYSMMGSYGLGGVFSKTQLAEVYRTSMGVLKEGFSFKIHSVTAEENRVLVEAQNTCEFIDNEIYDNFYVFVFIVGDMEIIRVTEYLDTLYLSKAFAKVEAHLTGASAEADAGDAAAPIRIVDAYFSNPMISF